MKGKKKTKHTKKTGFSPGPRENRLLRSADHLRGGPKEGTRPVPAKVNTGEVRAARGWRLCCEGRTAGSSVGTGQELTPRP